jgi:SulP family sulfate permease
MMMVVIGTFAWPSLKLLFRIPKEDAFVIILVTGVTVIQDLAIAVVVGVIVSCLVYAWKSSQQIRITESAEYSGPGKSYALHGTLFFGSVWKFKDLIHPGNYEEDNVILDLSNAKVADHSGLEAIDSQTAKYEESGKRLQLTNLTEESLKILRKAEKVTQINVVE